MAKKDNTFSIKLSDFYVGLSPLWSVNSLTEVGGGGHASVMTNCDVLSDGLLTQGMGLSNLTNGTQAGAVSELINFILDKAVSDSVTYGVGATKLYKITPSAITSDGTWPHTITNATDGESCIDMNGSLYYFYNKSSGGDIGKYDLSSTFDDDWGCYSNDTEVMTTNGWKLIEDVEVGEKIYSLNPETQEVEIATNKETINKLFDGEMIKFKNDGIDLLTTPDHKMYAGFRKMKDRKIFTDWQIVRADSLLDKWEIKLKKNANWTGKIIDDWEIPAYSNNVNYKKEAKKVKIRPFLRLLGFYISEGSSSQKHINIAQEKKSKGFNSIKNTLDELGFNYGYYGKGFDIHDKQLTQYIKKLIPGYCNEKRIPKEILELDKSLLIELYEAMMLGDGYLGTNQYYTVSEGLKDDFIELVNRLGWSSSLFIKDRRRERAHNGIARYISFTIGVIKTKNETTLNHHKFFGGRISKEHYKGNIVCLALDKNHIMLVRRNNKSVWCGNSTTPTGAAALQSAPHPVAVKEDRMIFGNGQYVGYYNSTTNTINVSKLDFKTGSEVVDVVFSGNQWLIAVNTGTSGTNRNQASVYLYDGAATSAILADEVGVGFQKIGWLYQVNGIVYIAYQDLSSTWGYKIGYLNGRQIKPLASFTGSLPNFSQKTLYKNTILFLSSGSVYSAGAINEELPFQISQLMDGGYATCGAIACPFGTPMIASTDGATNYKIAKASGYDTACSWKSIVFPISQGRVKGYIDEISILTNSLGANARADISIEYNQTASTSTAQSITGTTVSRHIFREAISSIEDFRVAISWSNGNTTNPVKIREIIIKGHYYEV